MGWNKRFLSPTRETPPKANIAYPCPALSRCAFMVASFTAALTIFYGGSAAFDLPHLDWAAPAWTAGHIALVAAGVIIGGLCGLLAFGAAMMIPVRSERLSDFYIVLWQFIANGSIVWIVTIGAAMSIQLGRHEARVAVINYGAEAAVYQALAVGSAGGGLMGLAYFLGGLLRLPPFLFLVFSCSLWSAAGYWHYRLYGIPGNSWIPVGLAMVVLLLIGAPAMIDRDRQQRRLAAEMTGW